MTVYLYLLRAQVSPSSTCISHSRSNVCSANLHFMVARPHGENTASGFFLWYFDAVMFWDGEIEEA